MKDAIAVEKRCVQNAVATSRSIEVAGALHVLT
jgi:hypothetical protein